MLKRWIKDSTHQKKTPESVPPFRVGDTTELILGRVYFLVTEIEKKAGTENYWIAHGKAVVNFHELTPKVDVEHITDNNGHIKQYLFSYTATTSGKRHLIPLSTRYTHHDDDDNEVCLLIVDEVELEVY